jgi:hypothetical protein
MKGRGEIMVFCNNCGTQVPDGATVCPKCGAGIGAPMPQPQMPPQMQPQMQPQMPPQPMLPVQKAKLGISMAIFGAGLYFMGLISIIPLVIAAGYVLLFEENSWLKKTAIKAVSIVVLFAIIYAGIGLLGNLSGVISDISALNDDPADLYDFNRVISLLRTLTTFAETIVLLIFGFQALNQGNAQSTQPWTY